MAKSLFNNKYADKLHETTIQDLTTITRIIIVFAITKAFIILMNQTIEAQNTNTKNLNNNLHNYESFYKINYREKP